MLISRREQVGQALGERDIEVKRSGTGGSKGWGSRQYWGTQQGQVEAGQAHTHTGNKGLGGGGTCLGGGTVGGESGRRGRHLAGANGRVDRRQGSSKGTMGSKDRGQPGETKDEDTWDGSGSLPPTAALWG